MRSLDLFCSVAKTLELLVKNRTLGCEETQKGLGLIAKSDRPKP